MFARATAQGVISLPSLATVPEELLRRVLTAPPVERVWLLLESLAPPETLLVLDRLPVAELRAEVIPAWELSSEIKIDELLAVAQLLGKHAHREALAADLIDRNLRLRDFPSDRCNWADLKVIVANLDVHAALYCAYYPQRAHWDLTNLLLADQVDVLRWLQWSKTKDGQKNRNRPKLVPRPGVATEQRDGAKPKAAPLSQVKARLASRYGKPQPTLGRREIDRAQALANVFGRGGGSNGN